MKDEAYPDALPAGHRLHWYVLEHVLGQGGFGITYLARDSNLDRLVAIKEYLPSEIARRRADSAAYPRTESQAERYAWGLERFLAEARTLARFTHANIVQVHSVFEANNTAYMVMRYEEGESLALLLDRSGTLAEQPLLACLLPILDGLQLVHAAGFIHRDIKPANIYMRQDGSPVLLDFGSARQAFGSSKTLTILVAPGYAPLEQYYSDGATQGAWTDIYSLGATAYRAIAGHPPLEAVARAKGVLGSAREVLEPAVAVGRGRYSERLLAAIDHALQLSEQDRPQDILSWRRELLGLDPSRPAPLSAPLSVPPVATEPARAAQARGANRPWLWPAAAALAALAGVAAMVVATRAHSPAVDAAPKPQLALAPPITSAAPKLASAPLVATPTAPMTSPAQKAPTAAPRPVPSPLLQRPPVREAPRPLAPVVAPAQPIDEAPMPTLAVASLATPSASAPSLLAQARSLRNDQIDAAEAALRRGEHTAAAQLLAPWADAGVARAQTLLGRVKEGRPNSGQSNFEAYVWYSIAARGGDAAAAALRDKVATRLQAAEIRQADNTVERWRPQPNVAQGGSTP